MTRLLAFLLLGFLASDCSASAVPLDNPKHVPLGKLITQRHHARYGELSSFLKVAWKPGSSQGTVVTLTDDHLDRDQAIQPDVLRKLLLLKHVSGISLRNTSFTSITQLTPLADRLNFLDLYGTPIDDTAIQPIAAFAQLKELDLGVTRVTSVGLLDLKPLTQLRVLDLSGRRILDQAIVALRPLRQLQDLSLSGTRITDSGVTQLASLTHLRALSLSGSRIQGDSLGKLSNLSKLTLLDLSDTDISGDSLAKLAACRSLQALHLENCPLIVDASTAHLTHFPSLRGLVLRKTGFEKESITAIGLVQLAKISTLEHLNLNATRLQDKSLTPLGQLHNLRRLDVGLTAITNASMPHIATLPRLEHLSLMSQVGFGGTRVTAAGLKHLVGHPTLRELDLTGIQINDDDLPALHALETLHRLTISGTAITQQGSANLARQLPNCRIVR